MTPTAELVRRSRAAAGLSVRALAEAAGVAASTVHRIERGRLDPTVGTLGHILRATGMRLDVGAHVDPALNLVGLARATRDDLAAGDTTWPVRRAAELALRFHEAEPADRERMLLAEPPPTGDAGWDAFLAGLAEWLAIRAALAPPPWAMASSRSLDQGWWVTPMRSLRAWEYAGSPASFQRRGVYLHRDSLVKT